MEEIGKALADLVKGSTNLAPTVISTWFWIRIFDTSVGLLECLTVVGGLYLIARAVLSFCQWHYENEKKYENDRLDRAPR